MGECILTSHDDLRVGVVIDVQFQTLCVLDLLKETRERLSFGSIAGAPPTEVLSTGVVGRAAANIPFVRPITVDVVAQTATTRGRLAVFAPHAVGGLCELESCSSLEVCKCVGENNGTCRLR